MFITVSLEYEDAHHPSVVCLLLLAQLFFTVRICRSYTQPICEALGRLNCHSTWFTKSAFPTLSSLLQLVTALRSSQHAPIMLVPLSERMCFGSPLRAVNLLRASMTESYLALQGPPDERP